MASLDPSESASTTSTASDSATAWNSDCKHGRPCLDTKMANVAEDEPMDDDGDEVMGLDADLDEGPQADWGAMGDEQISILLSKSKDQVTVNMPKVYCRGSEVLRSAVDGNPEVESLTIPTTEEGFENLVRYLEHYHGKAWEFPKIPKPLEDKDFKEQVPEWDFKYVQSLVADINVDDGKDWKQKRDFACQKYRKLNDMVNLAGYLNVKGLTQLTCALWASFFKGQSFEYILEHIFGVCPDIDKVSKDDRAVLQRIRRGMQGEEES